jgi:hypothetical protein
VARRRSGRRGKFQPVKRPGALRKWLKQPEVAAKIRRLTGESPFTKKGYVNIRALQKLRNTEYYERLSTLRKQQINFAITRRSWKSAGGK